MSIDPLSFIAGAVAWTFVLHMLAQTYAFQFAAFKRYTLYVKSLGYVLIHKSDLYIPGTDISLEDADND